MKKAILLSAAKEAAKRSSFDMWFKMKVWELDDTKEKTLEKLASEVYKYFNDK